MTTDQPIEGHWWLPESPSRRRFGRLLLDEDGWGLSLAGGLQEPPELHLGEVYGPISAEALVIHGQASDGTDVSLFECWSAGLGLPVEPLQEFWRFGSFVEGNDVALPHDLMGEVHIYLGSLLTWAVPSALFLSFDENHVTISSTTEVAGLATVDTGDVELVLSHAWSHGPQEASIKKTAFFRYKPVDGAMFPDAMTNIVLPLRDLLSFLSLGHVPVTRVAGLRFGDTGATPSPMWNYRAQLQGPVGVPEESPQHFDMMATRVRLGMGVDELLPAWFELRAAQLEAIKLLLLPGNTRYLYADDKMLTAFLAMESYHEVAIGGTAVTTEEHTRRVDAIVSAAPPEFRKWAEQLLRGKNTKGQRRKLGEVVDRAGSTGRSLIDAVPGFIDLALSCRHRIAHPSPSAENNGIRYVAVGMGLRWLLRHCLLADLGISQEYVTEIMGNCQPLQNELSLLRRWSKDLQE